MRRTKPRTPARSQSKRKRKAKPAATPAAQAPAQHTVKHPLFGAMPLVATTWVDANGHERSGYVYDASYRPEMPKGAVRGDITRQHFCSMCHSPRYFYVDVGRTCVQCGDAFVFSGAEQKFWYETLQFHFDSIATRCLGCRRKKRSDKALQQQLALATSEVDRDPENPVRLVALAEAIVQLFERLSQGSLPRAIAACRRARRICKAHPQAKVGEALFWEAKAQALAGRPADARQLFQQMLAGGGLGSHRERLAREAQKWLERN